MQRMSTLKQKLVRVLVALIIGQSMVSNAHAIVSIPVNVNLGTLAGIAPTIDIPNTFLTKWRTGVANQVPVQTSTMTFQYFASGSNLAYPTRLNPADNSANNQNALWSDNAIKLTYTRGNTVASAILIYTTNTVNSPNDPLGAVSLRGGLVGGYGSADPEDPNRGSVLPLVWKALDVNVLRGASNANVNGSVKISTSSALYMPTEVENLAGGPCPAEGPYAASARGNVGFCDYSTHFFIDQNNNDPANLWYTGYANGAQRRGAFNYSSVVGAFGVNTKEDGSGNGNFNPAYLVLGIDSTGALQTTYGTTIYLDVLNY